MAYGLQLPEGRVFHHKSGNKVQKFLLQPIWLCNRNPAFWVGAVVNYHPPFSPLLFSNNRQSIIWTKFSPCSHFSKFFIWPKIV